MGRRTWIALGTTAVLAAFAGWLTASLRNDDSMLSVVARYLGELKGTVCWSADTNVACVVKAMAKYEKKGRYDDAIRAGAAWVNKYPQGALSTWIEEHVSALYLTKSRMDRAHAGDYLEQAVLYRDKALISVQDSPYDLEPLVNISEAVGDLSSVQQCVQYRNSLKLLGRMSGLASEDKDRLTRQFKPDQAERSKLDALLRCIDVATKRIHAKLSASGCDEGQPPPN
jgi:hypothetical protein